MPAPATIVSREGAGSVEATRLAVRATPPGAAAQGSATLRSAPFGSGAIGPFELALAVEPGVEHARLDLAVRNAASHALWLESVVVGLRWPRDAGALRFLRHGWQSWSFTGSRALDAEGEPAFPSGAWLRGMHHAVAATPADRAGWHESDLVTVVGGSRSGAACCLVGALERGRAFGVVYARRDAAGVALELELRVDALLAAGERRELEGVRVALGFDASALLEDFAAAHGALAGARASAPFVAGWCSWYHFFHDVCEADVLRNLEALAAARDELPVEVVQIDDGYQRAVGDWLHTNRKFPRGLAPLAREIRAAGFTPGLWTAPFCAVGESAVAREHREWLLRDGDSLQLGLLHPQWAEDARVYTLDTSRAEVLRHLEDLFRSLVELGFDYLKLDFLYTAAAGCDADDPGVSRAARLRRGLEAIRRGAGEEAFLLGCGCPLGAAVGVVDGMRIGPDVAPAWRTPPGFRIPGVEETQPATRSALRSILARAWMHRRLWQNDPDCLMARADSQLTESEARTLASAIAVTGGMLVFSDDVPALSGERRALVRETLAAARRVDGLGLPGAARARDLLAAEFPSLVAAGSAAGTSVALFDCEDVPAEAAVALYSLAPAELAGSPVPLLSTRPASAVDGCLRAALEPHETSFQLLRWRTRLAVFCDFDGTFSVQDVGATLAARHAGAKRPRTWARYERGELSAWEYNLEVLGDLALPRTRVEEFLASVELDAGAAALVAWCAQRCVPFRVLSDGFDANLLRLQQLHGVAFAFDANHLRYRAGRWRIRAGHPNPACPCGTGTCKRARIEAFRAEHPGVTTVHIGNGRVSDLCGALAADVVFAKDSLATELAQRGVPFAPFATLHDVLPRLESLL
jgi:alpha-galactosidase